MKLCFVILHYLTADDTIECINSINSLDNNKNIEIIVVDNFSNNGSIEEVASLFEKQENCSIIYNSENLGYARGNNIGYEYARKNFPNSYIVIINNDTIVKQKDFVERVNISYEKYKYFIMGPDIISLKDGGNQNPMGTLLSKKEVNKEIIRYKILLALSKIWIYDLLKNKKKSEQSNIKNEKGSYEELDEKVLHGSCLIFSPDFVEKNIKPFNPNTFLYMEEMILARYCKEKNMKMVYDPTIEIFHKEDSSTNKKVTSNKEKREFVFKNLIKSCKIYKKVFK